MIDNITLVSDVAVLKSQGIETNRRFDSVDKRFDTLEIKVDNVLEAVNENKGKESQNIAFWSKVGGIATLIGGISGWVGKHL
jgi:hypothetical protein